MNRGKQGEAKGGLPIRDTQRQKVYSMEKKVFNEAYRTNITPEEARNIVYKLSRTFHVVVPKLNATRQLSSRTGYYQAGMIKVRADRAGFVNLGTVAHEFAHHLTFDPSVEGGHGPMFVRALREVMYHLGYKARITYSEHKVKVGSHRKFWDDVRRRAPDTYKIK